MAAASETNDIEKDSVVSPCSKPTPRDQQQLGLSSRFLQYTQVSAELSLSPCWEEGWLQGSSQWCSFSGMRVILKPTSVLKLDSSFACDQPLPWTQDLTTQINFFTKVTFSFKRWVLWSWRWTKYWDGCAQVKKKIWQMLLTCCRNWRMTKMRGKKAVLAVSVTPCAYHRAWKLVILPF